MRDYNPDEPLISIHIPKAAGTTMQLVLRRWFGGRLLLHYVQGRASGKPKRHRLTRRFGSGLRSGVCIHGHFNRQRGFGVEDYYCEVRQFIIMLRDPFELALSRWFFAQRRQENPGQFPSRGRAIERFDSIEQYLEKVRSPYRWFIPADLNEDNFEQILRERFVFVGVTERMDASLRLLARRLGFEPVDVPRANVSPRKQKVPEGARVMLEERWPLDFALHRYAMGQVDSV